MTHTEQISADDFNNICNNLTPVFNFHNSPSRSPQSHFHSFYFHSPSFLTHHLTPAHTVDGLELKSVLTSTSNRTQHWVFPPWSIHSRSSLLLILPFFGRSYRNLSILSTTFQYLKEDYRKNEKGLFVRECSDRTSGFKLRGDLDQILVKKFSLWG